MQASDRAESWLCVSSRNEDDVSKTLSVAEAYDNGICFHWFEETKNLTNANYKPIRDHVLQQEHLTLAYALEILEACNTRRSNIQFLRTDAIILSTPKKKMLVAKKVC